MKLKDNKIIFIKINQDYLKTLYDACSEVFYKPYGYDKKPYIGILVNINNQEYAIPLTSAKEKHKKWKDYSNGRMLVYDIDNVDNMSKSDIWKENIDNTVKHILSVLMISKMIPIKDGCYETIDSAYKNYDSAFERKYKDLLKKELKFCVSNKNKILSESNRIYNEQINSGVVLFGYCDFKALELASNKFFLNK